MTPTDIHPKAPVTLDISKWNTEYRDYLIRFALQKVSDYQIAEDLVQDTFLAAWNARDRFRGDCTERTWLTGVLRNKVIDHYRKTGRRPSVLATDLEFASNEEGDNNSSWMERRPDQRTDLQPAAAAERSEFMEELDQAVDHLPETMGKAFRMREIQGFSTEEITRTLNISKSNLWVLIHRAKQALSDQLKNNWTGGSDFGGPLATA